MISASRSSHLLPSRLDDVVGLDLELACEVEEHGEVAVLRRPQVLVQPRQLGIGRDPCEDREPLARAEFDERADDESVEQLEGGLRPVRMHARRSAA